MLIAVPVLSPLLLGLWPCWPSAAEQTLTGQPAPWCGKQGVDFLTQRASSDPASRTPQRLRVT